MNDKIYQTRNLYLASYLYATKEVKFDKAERDANEGFTFYFSPHDRATDLVSNYYNRTGNPVAPVDVFQALKELKTIMFTKDAERVR